MQQIFPGTPTVDDQFDVATAVASEPREHPDGRPWVFANMVTTIDGAATLDGRSGGLGGPADRMVFAALRDEADVIVVGAQTVRDEGYRLARAPEPPAAARRERRGQGQRARLCIVTRSSGVDDGVALLEDLPAPGAPAEPWQRPIVATVRHPRRGDETADGTHHGTRFDARFDRLEVGDDSVDLTRLVAELGALGLTRILCEGGPSLLAQLGAAGLIDEWNFTIAPLVAGGDSIRPLRSGATLATRLRLGRLFLEDDSTMFARYLTDRDVG